LSGGYSELCIAPAQIKAGVRYRDVERNANAERLMDSISEIPLQDGRTLYVRVQEQAIRSGKPRMVLVPVDQDQAVRELAGTRLQMHTVSRVKGRQPCQAVAVQATEAITLAGDTLFKFNRSDRAGLTDAGIQALEQLMMQLRSRYKSVEHVHLIGYTDPLGTDAYNQRLSHQRASTVSEYMQISPLLRGRVTTEGRGAKDLVVTDCGNTPTPQTQACNQPNRRVVVQVTGVRN
jgi:OmpA-OmpF porin, OOP family